MPRSKHAFLVLPSLQVKRIPKPDARKMIVQGKAKVIRGMRGFWLRRIEAQEHVCTTYCPEKHFNFRAFIHHQHKYWRGFQRVESEVYREVKRYAANHFRREAEADWQHRRSLARRKGRGWRVARATA